MTNTQQHRISRPLTAVLAAAICSATLVAQTPNFLSRESADVPTVKGAPFSGDAHITLKLRQYDGTPIERKLTGKYYRDSEGRVRRDQLVFGFGMTASGKDTVASVTIVDPVAEFVYTVLSDQREVLRMQLPIGKRLLGSDPAAALTPAPPTGVDVAKKEEPLGTRQIEGVSAVGTRTSLTIPAGVMGNERAVEVVEERWESAELKLVVFSRSQNPQSGEVEYRLTNIRRAEPSADLFKPPAGYKIVDIPPRGAGAR